MMFISVFADCFVLFCTDGVSKSGSLLVLFENVGYDFEMLNLVGWR